MVAKEVDLTKDNKDYQAAELDVLFNKVGLYKNSFDYMSLLEFVKKFRNIAPYNAFLLHIQRPGSTFVETPINWLNIFNRHIKPGANPLVILKPFGPVEFVYDLDDTEGTDPIPECITQPFTVKGEYQEDSCREILRKLSRHIIADSVGFAESNMSSSSAGYIRRRDNFRVDVYGKSKIMIWYDLVVNQNAKPSVQLSTVIHELGHLFCGHQGSYDDKRWLGRKVPELSSREFEAESVAWLVCGRLGLDCCSEDYLAGYKDKNEKIPPISIDTVLKAAGMVEQRIKKAVSPSKEIILGPVGVKSLK